MQSDKIRIVSEPWNHWYHCTASTYGTWLRGDPRGWRARHHREHVEGDYRNPPPPGTYAPMLAQSKKLMKRPAVHLPNEVRTQKERVEITWWFAALGGLLALGSIAASMRWSPYP